MVGKWIYLVFIIFSGQCVAKLHIVTEHFPPAQYLNDKDQLTGHVADKVRKALEASSLDYSITVKSWTTAFNTALRDPQTCIFSVSRSPEREDQLLWIAELAQLHTYFYALNSKQINLQNLEQAKQYRIAVLKDNYSHQYLLSQGFEEGKNLLPIDSFDNIFKIVSSRKNSIDLVTLPKQRAEFEQRKHPVDDNLIPVLKLNVKQPSLYFACNKGIDNISKSELIRVFTSL
ncbi:MAG: substrate-binding periplasmic protein [Pseudoalteromonas prydzensis]|uniref:Transporter substrate-binding domain-containing protein n=1 Tax=Pseudoalteromonas prydzensis TaxID=182141 RepID=A0A7V1GDT6_9GAMM|nr:transporter substrate-binding domain-containing protein [Pseudoalteromonas prydzensis]HEA16221.1 transporter substrate-binding domain-containing protein [Pseudoalteromonas prydzensis]